MTSEDRRDRITCRLSPPAFGLKQAHTWGLSINRRGAGWGIDDIHVLTSSVPAGVAVRDVTPVRYHVSIWPFPLTSTVP
jgi:hypothetical protein